MRYRSISVLVALVILAAPLSADQKKASKSPKEKQIDRGRYLVTIAGCHDCHSPKKPGGMEPDMTRMLSGRPPTTNAPAKPANMGEISVSGDLTAWYGPWGVSYTANITPDPVTGIGKRYNEASFIKAMRTGKKPEGEPLLPPMPWNVYAEMTDSDLKAVFAYLMSIKPISNNVRVAVPAAAAK